MLSSPANESFFSTLDAYGVPVVVIGKVEGERDDAKLGTVTLKLLWKADVAGGKSSYEVVRHAVRPRLAGTQDVDPDRRFDVTLLINGLPLIQFD